MLLLKGSKIYTMNVYFVNKASFVIESDPLIVSIRKWYLLFAIPH